MYSEEQCPSLMQDRELYQQLLCLDSPGAVSQTDRKVEEQDVLAQVTHPRGRKYCCSERERKLTCYHHSEGRRRRHLKSCHCWKLFVARRVKSLTTIKSNGVKHLVRLRRNLTS